jgi:hypothetical protein
VRYVPIKSYITGPSRKSLIEWFRDQGPGSVGTAPARPERRQGLLVASAARSAVV